jgi:hypothetical protein
MGSMHESDKFKKVTIDTQKSEFVLLTIKRGPILIRELVIGLDGAEISMSDLKAKGVSISVQNTETHKTVIIQDI